MDAMDIDLQPEMHDTVKKKTSNLIGSFFNSSEYLNKIVKVNNIISKKVRYADEPVKCHYDKLIVVAEEGSQPEND